MNIGATLKQIRIEKGFSQKKAAEKLGLSPTWLSQCETGIEDPGLKLIHKASKLYKIPVPAIFLRSLDLEDVDKQNHEKFRILKPLLVHIIKSIWNV